MAQNIYDNAEFFAGYSQLLRSREGLDGMPEWPALRQHQLERRPFRADPLPCRRAVTAVQVDLQVPHQPRQVLDMEALLGPVPDDFLELLPGAGRVVGGEPGEVADEGGQIGGGVEIATLARFLEQDRQTAAQLSHLAQEEQRPECEGMRCVQLPGDPGAPAPKDFLGALG